MIPQISLTPAVLSSVIQDPRFHEDFPFLKNPPKIAKACGCSNRPAVTMVLDVNTLKQTIVTMDGGRLKRFRELLGAAQVKAILPDHRGAPQVYYF